MENPLDNVGVPVRAYVEKIKQNINWNYIGLAAGILTVIVAVRNINNYLQNLESKE